MFRWSVIAASIFLLVFVQAISGALVARSRDHSVIRRRGAIEEQNQKHVTSLKAANPQTVTEVKRRLKASLRGRKPDQSNERNLWRSHPKKEDYNGPDTDEVAGLISELGI